MTDRANRRPPVRTLGADPFVALDADIQEAMLRAAPRPAALPGPRADETPAVTDARPAPDTSESAACPHLGEATNPGTHFLKASTAHRCFAGERNAPVAAEHQALYCLRRMHRHCEVFIAVGGIPVASQPPASEPPGFLRWLLERFR